MRILSISCGRSDVGILTPVWKSLLKNIQTELHVILTGEHIKNTNSLDKIILPSRAIAHFCGANIAGQENESIGSPLGAIVSDVIDLAVKIEPDRILIIGDRLEMMAAAFGISALNIPLVHLHGGEFSYGAIDDRLRHAISKLSHLHCSANSSSASIISRMGEECWRIHVTGAPGLDTLLNAEVISSKELAKSIGLPSLEGLRIVTVHAETNSPDPLTPARSVFAALEQHPAPTIVTAPNADPGSQKIRKLISQFIHQTNETIFIESLGNNLYPNVLRQANVMVGNSSSGIVEAGLFGLPVINVGQRQDGRQHVSNVIDVPAKPEDILKELITIPKRYSANFIYGDGCSGARVAKVVTNNYDRNRLLTKNFSNDLQEFIDPWEE